MQPIRCKAYSLLTLSTLRASDTSERWLFVVFHQSSVSQPKQLLKHHIWVTTSSKKQSQQRCNRYMKQNLELKKWNINGFISPGCDDSFSPNAATNQQQNSVRDVVQLFKFKSLPSQFIKFTTPIRPNSEMFGTRVLMIYVIWKWQTKKKTFWTFSARSSLEIWKGSKWLLKVQVSGMIQETQCFLFHVSDKLP